MAFNAVSPFSNWSLHESDYEVESFGIQMYSTEGLNEGDSPDLESHSEFGDDHEVDSSRSLQSSEEEEEEEEEDDEDDSKSEEPTAKRKRCEEPAENAEDDGEKKKKKKKRRAADWSGRQMALRRIAKERKARKTDEAKVKDEDEKQLPTALNFLTSVGESRAVLLDFLAEDDLLTEEHASAMRVYMNRKYGLSTTVSCSHFCSMFSLFFI